MIQEWINYMWDGSIIDRVLLLLVFMAFVVLDAILVMAMLLVVLDHL